MLLKPNKKLSCLAQKIAGFLINSEADMGSRLRLGEKQLLKAINFHEQLGLKRGKDVPSGLFGYESINPDYVSDECNAVVEVKYIRTSNGSMECEVKNAFPQIMENVLAQGMKGTVLVILDHGKAAIRPWDKTEKKFVRMFQQNPFGIALKVVRIRIGHGDKYEVEIV